MKQLRTDERLKIDWGRDERMYEDIAHEHGVHISMVKRAYHHNSLPNALDAAHGAAMRAAMRHRCPNHIRQSIVQ
jgi:hypothetical protein